MTGKELACLSVMLADNFDLSHTERVDFLVEITLKMFSVSEKGGAVPTTVAPPVKKAPNQSKVIVPKGAECVCSQCKKIAFQVTDNVYAEGMTGAEFLACFQPEPQAPLDMLTDEYGNEHVDCPLCGGEKSVIFIRRDGKVK